MAVRDGHLVAFASRSSISSSFLRPSAPAGQPDPEPARHSRLPRRSGFGRGGRGVGRLPRGRSRLRLCRRGSGRFRCIRNWSFGRGGRRRRSGRCLTRCIGWRGDRGRGDIRRGRGARPAERLRRRAARVRPQAERRRWRVEELRQKVEALRRRPAEQGGCSGWASGMDGSSGAAGAAAACGGGSGAVTTGGGAIIWSPTAVTASRSLTSPDDRRLRSMRLSSACNWSAGPSRHWRAWHRAVREGRPLTSRGSRRASRDRWRTATAS